MSVWSRLHQLFWKHPKVEASSLEAIGLWTVCNSWCRYKRTGGFIPEECPLIDFREDLVQELVDQGLWDEVEGGWKFHDWSYWYAHEHGEGIESLVVDNIRQGHPSAVVKALVKVVSNLLAEEQEPRVIAAALKKWDGRPNAAPSLLPHFVSDALRDVDESLHACIEECKKTGDVTPLRAYGLWFPEPDIPNDIKTASDIRAFMLMKKREWLKGISNESNS